VQDSRAAGATLALEGGDSFFKEARLPQELQAQWRDKAQLIAQAYGAFLDVYVPGELDLADGADAFLALVKAHKVPVVAANLTDADGKPLFPASVVKTVDRLKVLVVGVVDPVLFPRDGAVRATDAVPAIRSALKDAPGHDVAILVAHADSDAAHALAAAVPEFSLILTSHSGQLFFQPKVVPFPAGAPVDQALAFGSSKGGKYVARLRAAFVPGDRSFLGGEVRSKARFDLDAAQHKSRGLPKDEALKAAYEAARATVAAQDAQSHADFDAVGLEAGLREDAEIARKVAAYNTHNAEREAQYAARQAPPPSEMVKASPYAGSNACKVCHANAFEVWKETDHSHAMASLRKSSQQLDRECVGCHSTGYQQAGGYTDPAGMGAFAEVQCEACHGPSRAHAEGKSRAHRAAGEQTCRRCHTQDATPQFRFDRDRLRIKHWTGP